jgi:hypothetical protein
MSYVLSIRKQAVYYPAKKEREKPGIDSRASLSSLLNPLYQLGDY